MVTKEYVKVKLKDLKGYAKNNKVHTDRDIDEIVKSIEKTDYLSPILVDENNVIINGHGRKEALKKMGYEEIEVIKVTGLTEDQKKKARLLDNKITGIADYNIANIEFELAAINDLEINDLFSDIIFEPVDYSDIYKGMPEYEQEDLTSEFKIIVNFKSYDDMLEFGEKLGQNITPKTKSIWYPYVERMDLTSQKYVSEE